MKTFQVKLGLGRMSNHHPRDYTIEAKTEAEAALIARQRYYREVEAEVGPKAPIFGKSLCIESCDEVPTSPGAA